MTLEEMKSDIADRLVRHTEAMEHAEADGNSDYDYYEGLTDAYALVMVMLNELVLSEKGK